MKNRKVNIELLGIKGIRGMFYTVTEKPSERIVVFANGAPLPPDNGTLPEAESILKFDTDLFVPDYIGFSRSDGRFTPAGCVNTLNKLFNSFSRGDTGVNAYKDVKRSLKYKEIIFIGRSFGGMYVLLLPKHNPKINKIASIFPILDYKECGKIEGEETPEKFMKAMLSDGYKHLYRGIESDLWTRHFSNKDGMRPVENIETLKDAKIFIGHGKKDKNINFKHSKEYFNELSVRFPNRREQFRLKLYEEGAHDNNTSKKVVEDFLTWIKIPKKRL